MKSRNLSLRIGALLMGIVLLGLFVASCASASAKQVSSTTAIQQNTVALTAQTTGGTVQNITSKIAAGGYPEITVKKGIPVKWVIQADASQLNGCNNRLVIPSYNIEKTLEAGDNVIEFTPAKEGVIPYSCWMGMITGRINVISDDGSAGVNNNTATAASIPSALATSGGCCATVPGFENGRIPTDELAVAKVVNGIQEVTINVSAQGYSPAVAVVQKGLKTQIKFNAASLNSCNSYVAFPELNGSLDLSKGETQTPVLVPTSDFTFECGMGMLHGYVKVVDDITKIDLNAIKAEIGAYAASGNGASGGGCCGR